MAFVQISYCLIRAAQLYHQAVRVIQRLQRVGLAYRVSRSCCVRPAQTCSSLSFNGGYHCNSSRTYGELLALEDIHAAGSQSRQFIIGVSRSLNFESSTINELIAAVNSCPYFSNQLLNNQRSVSRSSEGHCVGINRYRNALHNTGQTLPCSRYLYVAVSIDCRSRSRSPRDFISRNLILSLVCIGSLCAQACETEGLTCLICFLGCIACNHYRCRSQHGQRVACLVGIVERCSSRCSGDCRRTGSLHGDGTALCVNSSHISVAASVSYRQAVRVIQRRQRVGLTYRVSRSRCCTPLETCIHHRESNVQAVGTECPSEDIVTCDVAVMLSAPVKSR